MTSILYRWSGLISLLVCVVTLHAEPWRVSIPEDFQPTQFLAAEKVYDELSAALPEGVWIAPMQAKDYAIVPDAWLQHVLLPEMLRQAEAIRRDNAAMENTAGVCHTFSLLLRLMANLAAVKSKTSVPLVASIIVGQEHNFGRIPPDSTEDHAGTLVRTERGWWYVEPQSAMRTKLENYPNRQSIRLVSFH